MQGVLDEQFLQLQQLQDEASPNFVSEVVNIYFHESEKLLNNLRGLLYVINLLQAFGLVMYELSLLNLN